MSAKLKQLIENIGELSSAEKRYSELESGVVKGVSWQEIKDSIQG